MTAFESLWRTGALILVLAAHAPITRATELPDLSLLLGKLGELERCVDGRGSCVDLVGPKGILLMRVFPATGSGPRGGEHFSIMARRQFDASGETQVPSQVPISIKREFESITVGQVTWPERKGRPQEGARCVVDEEGEFCAAAQNSRQLTDLIRDTRDSVTSAEGDFQVVQISSREWLLSRRAFRYSGFPFGSYLVLSRVGKHMQVSAFVILL